MSQKQKLNRKLRETSKKSQKPISNPLSRNSPIIISIDQIRVNLKTRQGILLRLDNHLVEDPFQDYDQTDEEDCDHLG